MPAKSTELVAMPGAEVPHPPGFDLLPGWLQVTIIGAVGAAVFVAAGLVYLRALTKSEPPAAPAKSDLVLSAASLTDMAPLRDLSRNMGDLINETRGVRHSCDAILAHLIEIEREREEDRRVERRVKEELIDRTRRLREASDI